MGEDSENCETKETQVYYKEYLSSKELTGLIVVHLIVL